MLLGAGYPYHRHIAPLRKAGYRVVAVDRDPAAPGLGLADAAVVASIRDAGAVVAAAREHRADAIVATTESSVIASAAASAQLGLPGPAPAVALAMTNKGRMRALWKAAGLRQPEFVVAGLARGGARCPATVRAAGGGQAGRGLGQQRGLGRGRGRRHRAFARGRLRRPWRPGNRRALRRRPAADRRGLCRGGRRRGVGRHRRCRNPIRWTGIGWEQRRLPIPAPSPSATKPSAVSSGPAT